MFGFNVNKLKPNLTMAVHRIGIVKNKKANAALVQRREVARLLREGKEEKARIRVRHHAPVGLTLASIATDCLCCMNVSICVYLCPSVLCLCGPTARRWKALYVTT